MSLKTFIYIWVFVGSLIGGYVPILFGASLLSFSSILWSGIGSLVGIAIGYKIGTEMGL